MMKSLHKIHLINKACDYLVEFSAELTNKANKIVCLGNHSAIAYKRFLRLYPHAEISFMQLPKDKLALTTAEPPPPNACSRTSFLCVVLWRGLDACLSTKLGRSPCSVHGGIPSFVVPKYFSHHRNKQAVS